MMITRLPIARVIALCGVVVTLDGFDTQALAFVAPLIAKEWSIPVASFAVIFASSLFGLMLGGMFLGASADYFGRKKILLTAMLVFSLGSMVTAYADSFTQLLIWRFITGVGLGAALPNVIALSAEYAPEKRRATLVILMFCGMPLGAVLGGAASALWLIPHYGWRSVFLVGGALPLLILPLIAYALPESIRFLQLKADALAAKTSKAEGLARVAIEGEVLDKKDIGASRLPIRLLFMQGRAAGTLLLWLTFFMNMLVMHFMMSWLPSLLQQSGLTIDRAIAGTVALNAGGVLGGLLLGRMIDKYGALCVLPHAAFAGSLSVAVVGMLSTSVPVLMMLLAVTGCCVIGAQLGVNSLSATFYPVAARATGIGWAFGMGRVGSITGPVVGGLLITWKLDTQQILLLTAIPAFLGALALFIMGWVSRSAAKKVSHGASSGRVPEKVVA